MNREFLGTGWTFPVETTDAADVAVSTGETDIDEAIRIILGTAKGERVMRPDFGCGIHDFVFAAVNTATVTMIQTSVEEALRKWEPRIEVRDVSVDIDDIDRGRLLVSVEYRVRQTNATGNLVYPFYINE
ncbi:hypothetical protein SAMN04487947_3534 [Halogeometricum rufum]|jgi:hypothetical protein|uniref:IraD/Gp25-like domain-containing protein n=1 Tax=Halogeometricum rufum TaxID=553469 RepID=A0A1I6IQR2_9EURY|nr:GPW/gp25 family protein [Halogeometricum rufum]SFR68969.1 hypothetical protein SAMN04487947_3534 [Halogeometricum rufum]